MDAATIISWSEQELWLPLKLVSNSSIPIRLRLQMKYDPLYPYIGALWAELYLHPLDLATHLPCIFVALYKRQNVSDSRQAPPCHHNIAPLSLSLSLFPQNRSEFNLSVTKLRDQSGARSDNGMGAGEPGWNTSSVQQISGRKKYSQSFVPKNLL